MFNFPHVSSKTVAFLTLGLAVGAVVPLVNLAPGAVRAAPDSEASFPDIQEHWARPFIEPLAEKDIVAGYLDGTFRPNKPVQRDEFAALVRQAFDQEPTRKISSGTVYKDVPSGYWAAPAIAEAYKTGFMTGYPGGFFRPNQNISRVEALVSLTKNSNLSSTQPTASTTQTITNQPVTNQAKNQAIIQQASTGRATKKRVFFPLAMTNLMQPLFVKPERNQSMPASSSPSAVTSDKGASSSGSPSAVTSNKTVSLTRPASFTVSNYYVDAKKIPHYAVDDVAVATKANMVVNYPNPRLLNPNQPATRGDVAAFIYQALVTQGKLQPLPGTVPASNYIVDRIPKSTPSTPKSTPSTPKSTPSTPKSTPSTPKSTPSTPKSTLSTPKNTPKSTPSTQTPQ